MSGEKEPRKRYAFGPLYTTEDVLSEVNSIPEISKAVTGTDKIVAIIRSFSFLHEWQDKVKNLDSGQSANEEHEKRIQEMQSKIDTHEENVRALSTENERLDGELQEANNRIAELEQTIQQMEGAASENNSEEVDGLQQRIAELEEKLQAAQGNKPTWDSIRGTLDPVYAEMMEYMARELGNSDPLLMAIDIFVKYHVHRYAELPFQPFIPSKTLDDIIRANNPKIDGLRGLQKLLK